MTTMTCFRSLAHCETRKDRFREGRTVKDMGTVGKVTVPHTTVVMIGTLHEDRS